MKWRKIRTNYSEENIRRKRWLERAHEREREREREKEEERAAPRPLLKRGVVIRVRLDLVSAA